MKNEAAKQAIQAWRMSLIDGLSVDVSMDLIASNGAIQVESISVNPSARNTGLASRAMEGLMTQADVYSVPIQLEVGGENAGIDGDMEALVNWYTRLGFVYIDGFMERPPIIDQEQNSNQSFSKEVCGR